MSLQQHWRAQWFITRTTLFSHNNYSSSFGVFCSVLFLSIFANSRISGTISFQNATFSAWYLFSTLGFTSRTRYSCSCSVYFGHVTGEGPESSGFGDLKKRKKERSVKKNVWYGLLSTCTQRARKLGALKIYFVLTWQHSRTFTPASSPDKMLSYWCLYPAKFASSNQYTSWDSGEDCRTSLSYLLFGEKWR